MHRDAVLTGAELAVRAASRLGVALAGATLGLGWGVAARAWMRLISPEPGFSWSGTGYILGACAVVGLLLGGLATGRRRWHPAVRAVLLLAAAAPAALVARDVWRSFPGPRGGLGIAVWLALAATLVLAFSVPFLTPVSPPGPGRRR